MSELINLPSIDSAVHFVEAVCSFNAEPYRQFANDYVAKYNGLEFTEEDIKDVKKIIAEMNNIVKDMTKQRIAIKKEFNKPYESFEDEINSVTTIYEGAVSLLKAKIATFEIKYKAEKQAQLESIIKEIVAEVGLNDKYAQLITVTEQYLNSSFALSKAKKDILQRCQLQFTNQENERLAKEAEAERAQRRIKLLDDLNANYTGKIAAPIPYSKVVDLSDEEIVTVFQGASQKYLAKLEQDRLEQQRQLEAQQREQEAKQSQLEAEQAKQVMQAASKSIDEQLAEVDALVGQTTVSLAPSESPFTYNNSVSISVSEPVKPVEPVIQTELSPTYVYECTISTTAPNDTILPWLQEMKKHGIVTYVHKRKITPHSPTGE